MSPKKLSQRERAARAKKRRATIQKKRREELLAEAIASRAHAKAAGWSEMRAAYFRVESPDEAIRDELLRDGLIEQIFDRAARDGIAVVGGSQTFALTDAGERVAKRLQKAASGMSYAELTRKLRGDPEVQKERAAEEKRQRDLREELAGERREREAARAAGG